jgi:hypothetical protein
MPLTALAVKSAKPQTQPYKLWDAKGLFLLVTPAGSKLWRFNYRFAHKRRTLAMGQWPGIELAVARQRRDNARIRLAEGEDPAAADKVEAAARELLFETVARNWHAGAKSGWTARYAGFVLGRMEADIFPHIGRDDLNSIEPTRLLEVIRKVEARGAIDLAKRLKNYCSEVFLYGIAEGKCQRDPAADIRRALQKPRPKKHHAAVPQMEVPTLLFKIRSYDGEELTKLALQFTLLNMVRTQETRFAQWTEFETTQRK